MKNILEALIKALLDMFRPRILILLVVPPIVSFVFWGAMAFIFWGPLVIFGNWAATHFLDIHKLPSWAADWLPITPDIIATSVAGIVVFLSMLPLAFLTTLILTQLLVMPVVVRVLRKEYRQLERKGGGANAFVSNFKNLFKTSVIYIVLWLVTIPMWFLPGMNILIPLLLNAYLNYRLFLFDALGEFGTLDEIHILLKTKRTDFFLMGLITSLVFLFPLSFLIGPVYTALAFTRLAFAELDRLRVSASSGEASSTESLQK